MNAIQKRYGTVLRIYDHGVRGSADRFTLIPPRWAKDYRENSGLWFGFGCDANPFHPQGIGMHGQTMPGNHLGQRIHWKALPDQVKRYARQSFPEFCPLENDETENAE
jgi:hypothetical protein